MDIETSVLRLSRKGIERVATEELVVVIIEVSVVVALDGGCTVVNSDGGRIGDGAGDGGGRGSNASFSGGNGSSSGSDRNEGSRHI